MLFIQIPTVKSNKANLYKHKKQATVGIWNPTIQNPEFFEGQISNGPFVVGFQMVPTIQKSEKWQIKSKPN